MTVMTNLTYLELGSNKLTDLPSEILAQLVNLNSLWLYGNQIKVDADNQPFPAHPLTNQSEMIAVHST